MRVEIRRATKDDVEFIKMVYTEKDILPLISDDGNSEIKDIELEAVIMASPIYTLIPSLDGIRIGVFLLHPWNFITYELHTVILPAYRGEFAVEAARLMGKFMFTETPCRKMVTHVPKSNYPAKVLAKKCGMILEGINRYSYLKNGQLHDQYLFGITKEEAACQ